MLAHLLDARSSSVAELRKLSSNGAGTNGYWCLQRAGELSGEIVCTKPLTAPLERRDLRGFQANHHGAPGRREQLGLKLGGSESEGFWSKFIGSL